MLALVLATACLALLVAFLLIRSLAGRYGRRLFERAPPSPQLRSVALPSGLAVPVPGNPSAAVPDGSRVYFEYAADGPGPRWRTVARDGPWRQGR